MKKKLIFLLILIISLFPILNSTSLSFGPGYLSFTGDAKDIYNKSNIFYTAELTFDVSKFNLFIDANISNFKGELSFNKDDTTLKLTQIDAGIIFPFTKKTGPYLGAGTGITFYKENNSIGNASGTGFGFFGVGGIKFVFGKAFLDLRAKYTMLKIKGADLSGLSASALFGITF